MKKILVVLLAAIVGISAVNAQPTKKQLKAVKAEVASWEAEGCQAAPGDLSIAEQILMQKEYAKKLNNNGEPLYIFGSSTAVGQTFKAAQLSVMRGVKMNALEQLDTEITAIIQNDLANKQQSLDKAVSVDKVVSAAMERVSASLGQGIVLVTMHREVPHNGNVEVNYHCAYSYKKLKELAVEAQKKSLQQEIDELRKQL